MDGNTGNGDQLADEVDGQILLAAASFAAETVCPPFSAALQTSSFSLLDPGQFVAFFQALCYSLCNLG